MRRLLRLSAVALLLAPALRLTAQQAPTPAFRSNVSVVVVDVAAASVAAELSIDTAPRPGRDAPRTRA